MTDRPEKWKGLERVAQRIVDDLDEASQFPFVKAALARDFGPLLDAAEKCADWVGNPTIKDRVREQLERFK